MTAEYMTGTVKKDGGMLGIFTLMDYLIIIHDLNRLGGGLVDFGNISSWIQYRKEQEQQEIMWLFRRDEPKSKQILTLRSNTNTQYFHNLCIHDKNTKMKTICLKVPSAPAPHLFYVPRKYHVLRWLLRIIVKTNKPKVNALSHVSSATFRTLRRILVFYNFRREDLQEFTFVIIQGVHIFDSRANSEGDQELRKGVSIRSRVRIYLSIMENILKYYIYIYINAAFFRARLPCLEKIDNDVKKKTN